MNQPRKRGDAAGLSGSGTLDLQSPWVVALLYGADVGGDGRDVAMRKTDRHGADETCQHRDAQAADGEVAPDAYGVVAGKRVAVAAIAAEDVASAVGRSRAAAAGENRDDHHEREDPHLATATYRCLRASWLPTGAVGTSAADTGLSYEVSESRAFGRAVAVGSGAGPERCLALPELTPSSLSGPYSGLWLPTSHAQRQLADFVHRLD